LLLIREFGWSIILEILHEPRLGFIHNIIVMRSALLRRVVEARSCLIGTCAEARGVHLPLVLILFTLASNRSSSIGKLSPCVWFIWFIESIGMTIGCRFSSATYCCVISTSTLRVELPVRHVPRLVIDRLFTTVGSWIRCRVERLIIVVILSLVSIYRHVVDWVAGTSSLSLLS
jgi:hypothetical protein